MKETTQTNLPTFPVELYGHSLKYEIECMLKIFLPMLLLVLVKVLAVFNLKLL